MNSTSIQQWNSACPSGFVPSSVSVELFSPHSLEKTWDWLNRKETFTQGQIPPYRVEFVSKEAGKKPEFEEGCYNNHHGPFLHLPAQITVMEPCSYREMQYLYGSFVFSFRLIRPTALKFYLEEKGEGCLVRVVLEAQTRPFVLGMWESFNRFFWKKLFGPALKKIS